MQIILLIFGMFMDDYAVLTICAPIFMPIAVFLGFDPFGLLSFLFSTCRWPIYAAIWLGANFNGRGSTAGDSHTGHLAVDPAVCRYSVDRTAIDHAVSPTRFMAAREDSVLLLDFK